MKKIREFKPIYATPNEKYYSEEKMIKFADTITRTTSRYDFDREISYRNRRGEEFTRI
ncbi:MAG: hypothetical protein IKF83_04810 [Clostridia bacterium]|nr:hypothetical protein [Clostridia bacterium]